jgi:hypothetical protein
MLEVATASSCHWKLHGRIRGYSEENPINQYDRAVISPYVRTSRKYVIISLKPLKSVCVT